MCGPSDTNNRKKGRADPEVWVRRQGPGHVPLTLPDFRLSKFTIDKNWKFFSLLLSEKKNIFVFFDDSDDFIK